MPSPPSAARLESFPGWELVAEGLADIAADRITPATCVVWISWPRLKRAGLVDDALLVRRLAEPERVLHHLLSREGGGAYSRYNAILRRLGRFEHALDRAMYSGRGK